MTVNMRRAGPRPFHFDDCHMRNHSPPTVRKARNHSSRPSVRPALKEWRGTSERTQGLIAAGLAVLAASTVIVGYGNLVAARGP